MAACDFPNTEAHHALHAEITAKVNHLADMWHQNRDLEHVYQLRDLIRKWLINHVSKADSELLPYTKGKALAIRKAFEDLE